VTSDRHFRGDVEPFVCLPLSREHGVSLGFELRRVAGLDGGGVDEFEPARRGGLQRREARERVGTDADLHKIMRDFYNGQTLPLAVSASTG